MGPRRAFSNRLIYHLAIPYGLSKYSDLFLFTFTQFFSSVQVTLWADVPGLGPSAPVRYLLSIRGI